MKRVLALFLTVMLLATLLPASIVAEAGTVTKKGFYLVNWDRQMANDDYEYDYVYGMPYTWINSANYNSNSEHINIGVYFDGYSTSNIETAAAEMKDEFSKYPAGSRYINLAALASVFKSCAKDVIDMEDGVRLVADWVDRFLAEYKSIGGELDGIAIDLEYNSYTSFYLQSNNCVKGSDGSAPKNLDIMQDIVRNERVYRNIIRPQLVEYEKQGLFKFYTKGINPETGLPDDLSLSVGPEYGTRVPIPVSEITSINRYDDNGGDANSRSTWSWVMSNYLMGCITRAVYEPMVVYYPNAILSDYSNGDTYSWNKSMSNSGSTTGTSVKAGNASNGVYYGSQFSEYFWATYSNSKTRQIYFKPASYNGSVFDPTDKFTRTLYDVNNFKRILLSSRDKSGEDAIVNVWVPYFHYANTTKSYGNSAYFTELMYHMGMANPEPFLGYIIKSEVQNKGKNYPDDDNMGNYYYALEITDEILAELTRVAGASDRKAIETPMDWNKGYILSGMYAGGRNIWRITPDTSEISVKDFKVKDTAPTFRVNGVTITFPQGRIIKDTTITQIGSCGYWVETPAGVTPVVTTDAKLYENNPSFYETFTNYKLGEFTGSAASMLKTTSGRPDTFWTLTGTADIRKVNGSQGLALNGTTTLVNAASQVDKQPTLSIPAQVTAGDNYAMQQAWEVKVTLPNSELYSELKLFTFDDGDSDKLDYVDGFILSGGKVKYNQNGTQKVLDGVNVGEGGTYTFKMMLDFRKAGAHTASYYVYNESGKLLGSAENVALNTSGITLPVSKIQISTTSAADAIVLDDYKLYPVGLTTQLDIYETSRGRKLTDTTTPRKEDTAYRFTWMNAGDTYKVARIYDSVTGTIIKKVEMAPGTDGVISDLIKVGDGQQIRIAVNVQDATAPTPTNYDNGNFRWTAVSETIGLATGVKPAASGNDDTQETVPPTTEDDEEGENIFDVVGGNGNGEDLNNGSGDATIPGTDNEDIPNDNTQNPDNTENPGNAENPENPGTPEDPGVPEDPADPGEKGKGGMIALIVILSLAVLGGGAAAYIFLVKPKLAAKANPEEETK